MGKKHDSTSRKDSASRRKFLKTGAGLGAAGLLAACGSGSEPQGNASGAAPARNARTLRMVTTWPKNFPGLGTSAERFADRIRALTEGTINIRVYAAGELVPALGSFDAVSAGNADLYHGGEYYWQGKSPAFNFFAAVPFGMTATEMAAWIYHGGGQELWDELSARFNVKPFMGANSGTQMGGWFRKDINTVADFQGLRIRIPGLGGEVLSRVGATPVTRPGGEIFLALSQGNIDATEWVGPWNDLAFGFHEIVKNYYYPGFHEPGTALSIGINLDLWNDFDDFEKAAFEMAAMAETNYSLAEFNTQNARALAALINEHGVQLKRFPEPVLARLADISAEVLEETAGADDITRRVYESFMSAREGQIRWGEIAEQAIAEARRIENTRTE